MVTWSQLEEKHQNAAETLFCALSAAHHLQDAEPGEKTISFLELRRFVNHPDKPISQEIIHALLTTPRLQRDMNRLIRERSICYFPRQAAADSGELISREANGFQVHVHPSQVEQTQMFVLIHLAAGKKVVPKTMFILKSGCPPVKRALPPPQDGVIQLLEDAETDVVRALRDLDTEIYLNRPGYRDQPQLMHVRVVIGTTNGPSEVQRLAKEDSDVRSVVCLDGTTRALPISADYDAFVRKPTGVVQTLFGHPVYRMDVSAPIDGGHSWQLGALLAHALFHAGSLAENGEEVYAVAWLTGQVDNSLSIRPVENVRAKLERSRPYLLDQVQNGLLLTIAMHPDDRNTLDNLWMSEKGMEKLIPFLHAVKTVEALTTLLNMTPMPNAETLTRKRPVLKSAFFQNIRHKLLQWGLIMLIMGLMGGVWFWKDSIAHAVAPWLDFKLPTPTHTTQQEAASPPAQEATPPEKETPPPPPAVAAPLLAVEKMQFQVLELTAPGMHVCAEMRSRSLQPERKPLLQVQPQRFADSSARKLCGLVYRIAYPDANLHLAIGLFPLGDPDLDRRSPWSTTTTNPLLAGQFAEVEIRVPAWLKAPRTYGIIALASTEPFGDVLSDLEKRLSFPDNQADLAGEIQRMVDNSSQSRNTIWQVATHRVIPAN